MVERAWPQCGVCYNGKGNFMIKSILIGTMAAISIASPAWAVETAYTAMKTACASLGKDAHTRVLEVSGLDGRPQPGIWKVTIENSGDRGGVLELEVQKGRVVGKRVPIARPSGSRLNLSVIQLDSDGVFSIADNEAVRAGLSYDRLNYTLGSANQAGLPTWSVELYDGPSVRVATLKIAADNALVLERSPELSTSENDKRASRWSKPGEQVKSVPDGFHRFGIFTRSTAYKLKNWSTGYGWTDERNPDAPRN